MASISLRIPLYFSIAMLCSPLRAMEPCLVYEAPELSCVESLLEAIGPYGIAMLIGATYCLVAGQSESASNIIAHGEDEQDSKGQQP